jgi:hypothetical protein
VSHVREFEVPSRDGQSLPSALKAVVTSFQPFQEEIRNELLGLRRSSEAAAGPFEQQFASFSSSIEGTLRKAGLTDVDQPISFLVSSADRTVSELQLRLGVLEPSARDFLQLKREFEAEQNYGPFCERHRRGFLGLTHLKAAADSGHSDAQA